MSLIASRRRSSWLLPTSGGQSSCSAAPCGRNDARVRSVVVGVHEHWQQRSARAVRAARAPRRPHNTAPHLRGLPPPSAPPCGLLAASRLRKEKRPRRVEMRGRTHTDDLERERRRATGPFSLSRSPERARPPRRRAPLPCPGQPPPRRRRPRRRAAAAVHGEHSEEHSRSIFGSAADPSAYSSSRRSSSRSPRSGCAATSSHERAQAARWRAHLLLGSGGGRSQQLLPRRAAGISTRRVAGARAALALGPPLRPPQPLPRAAARHVVVLLVLVAAPTALRAGRSG